MSNNAWAMMHAYGQLSTHCKCHPDNQYLCIYPLLLTSFILCVNKPIQHGMSYQVATPWYDTTNVTLTTNIYVSMLEYSRLHQNNAGIFNYSVLQLVSVQSVSTCYCHNQKSQVWLALSLGRFVPELESRSKGGY